MAPLTRLTCLVEAGMYSTAPQVGLKVGVGACRAVKGYAPTLTIVLTASAARCLHSLPATVRAAQLPSWPAAWCEGRVRHSF